jgi:hypothetical protein
LFSRADVALFVNTNFEPAWEMVRPVPIVRIDFGNGTVLTRTLHGNIATSVCTAEGQVLDILPGIYTAPAYLHRLNQFRLLANYIHRAGPEQREARLREYHQGQAEALAKNEAPPRFVNQAGLSKAEIERGVLAVLVPGKVADALDPPAAKVARVKDGPQLDAREDVANWKLLAEDTVQNDTLRRRQIHEALAAKGLVRPQAVTKWLYKEVLHADLDDPYLGLGDVLYASYPFAKEDSAK